MKSPYWKEDGCILTHKGGFKLETIACTGLELGKFFILKDKSGNIISQKYVETSLNRNELLWWAGQRIEDYVKIYDNENTETL